MIPTIVTSDSKDAIKEGLRRSAPTDLVIVTGSLYLVGEVREFLRSV